MEDFSVFRGITMAHAINPYERRETSPISSFAGPAHQANAILNVAFVVLPFIAGLDKFFHVLVNWDMYLAPRQRRFCQLAVMTLCWWSASLKW